MKSTDTRLLKWRNFPLVVALAVVTACGETPTAAVPTEATGLSAAVSLPREMVFNRYVVLLRDDVVDVPAVTQQLVSLFGGVPFYHYETAVRGFAVANLPSAAVPLLRAHPLVRRIEVDALLEPGDVQSLPLDGGTFQNSSQWGLDRIDEQAQAYDGTFEYPFRGTGVNIYIIDSGIRCGHQDFAGRIGNGVTKLAWDWGASPCIDQDGHGTAVAGVAGGATYGVAKGARLHPVRINDDGTAHESDIIAGLDWVAANANRPAVANLSYQGSGSIRDAMQGVAHSRIVMTKAAGNNNVDAMNDPGNSASGAIVTGATTRVDSRSSFSNYGSLVTVFAPGSQIRTTGIAGDASTVTVSGTSFAAPFAAGVAALYMEEMPPNPNDPHIAFTVRGRIRDSSTPDVLSNVGPGSPNKLLYSKLLQLPPGPVPPLTAYINGNSTVQSNEMCQWFAIASGGSGSLSYAWTVDGQPIGGDVNWVNYTNSGNPFTIAVAVTDSEGRRVIPEMFVNIGSDYC